MAYGLSLLYSTRRKPACQGSCATCSTGRGGEGVPDLVNTHIHQDISYFLPNLPRNGSNGVVVVAEKLG